MCIARIYLSDSPQPVPESEPVDESTGKPKKPEKPFGVLEKATPMEITDPAEPKVAKPQGDKNYKPFASKSELRIFGILIAAVFAVTYSFFSYAYISVFCFRGALMSFYLVGMIFWVSGRPSLANRHATGTSRPAPSAAP